MLRGDRILGTHAPHSTLAEHVGRPRHPNKQTSSRPHSSTGDDDPQANRGPQPQADPAYHDRALRGGPPTRPSRQGHPVCKTATTSPNPERKARSLLPLRITPIRSAWRPSRKQPAQGPSSEEGLGGGGGVRGGRRSRAGAFGFARSQDGEREDNRDPIFARCEKWGRLQRGNVAHPGPHRHHPDPSDTREGP